MRRSALCCALSAEQLAVCNRIAYRKHFPAGRLICDVDQVDWFGIVISGVVKLTKALADGRQQIVELLFPSDFLGRPFRSGGGYAAEAASAVELCCFHRQQFESLMLEWPQLKQTFLERTLDEVDAAREWMLLLGRKSASEKVAALILLIRRRMREPGLAAAAQPRTVRFDLPLSRTEMADYLGLRIETVSRQLARLREAGVIAIPRGRTVVVRDLAALERMAEVDLSRPSLCNSAHANPLPPQRDGSQSSSCQQAGSEPARQGNSGSLAARWSLPGTAPNPVCGATRDLAGAGPELRQGEAAAHPGSLTGKGAHQR